MSKGFQITRLRVEQLRRFGQPYELNGFGPGLNIFAGPNEAGKSTLVRAIRAAFFERHRSTAVEDLRPWGEGSSASPQVEMDFILDGEAHRLVKTFLGKKRCTLQIGARTLDSTDAEDHLAQIFGFAFAGKGASKPEHWGIPGLLWVEQGTGQDLDVSHARDHLHDALQGQAGASASALAATGGDALLDQLRALRSELLTTTGKPRGAYAEAVETMGSLREQLDKLDAQIATYRDQVDRLAVLRRDHAADETAKPWDALREELASAEQRQIALRATQDQLQVDQGRLRQLEETRALLLKEIEALEGQKQQARKREQELVRAAQEMQAADAAVLNARERSEAASRRVHATRATRQAARQEADRLALAQQLERAKADHAIAAQNLRRAEEAQQHLFTLRDTAAAAPSITKAQVQQLVKLEQAERDADLRRQAVATRLQFTLPEGQSLKLQTPGESQRLEAQGERLLDTRATLQLPGGGELVITPGGEDLTQLARTHRDAREALQSALQGFGVPDVAAAQARRAAVEESEAQIRMAQQALAIVAPQGPEPLRSRLGAIQAQIRTAEEGLARLPETAAECPMPLAQAEIEHEAALVAEQKAGHELGEAQRLQAGAQSLHDTASREHQAAQAALSDPARQQREAHAREQLLANGVERQGLADRMALAEAEVREARPDILAQDVERLRSSIAQWTRSHQQRREDILLLENTLQQAGAQGLEELREAQAGRLAQAERRHLELQRRANALDLLCRRIDEKREATLARLQAPLKDRLHHYLPLLMPGATVQMDAGLAPETLTRTHAGGAIEAGHVQNLSFGAREQLGLISRFAYADLLQQAGRPTLLILDDTLVHSDAQRLMQMKRVLFDAAQRHQVLLFTCHPENWRDLGVAVTSLADVAKTPGASSAPQRAGSPRQSSRTPESA